MKNAKCKLTKACLSFCLFQFSIIIFQSPALSPSTASAQGVDYLREHYTKREYQVPMRDGAKLFTAVYSPKDASQKYPIILYRTQSGVPPYGEDQFPPALGPSTHFVRSKYIFIYQDIRGRYMSDGDFVVLRPHNPNKRTPQDVDESSDAYDTI